VARRRDPLESEVERLAGVIAKAVGRRTVAVLDIPNLRSQSTELGSYISEQLTTDIVRQLPVGGRVVERSQIQQVLKELKLASAVISPEEQDKLGKALGADAIVLGTYSLVGSRVTVNARLVAVGGREMLAADRLAADVSRDLVSLDERVIVAGAGRPEPSRPASGGAPAAAASPAAGPATEPARAVEESGIRVTLDGCRRTGTVLECVMRHATTTTDGSLWGPVMSVFDLAGQEHRANGVDLRGGNPGSWNLVTGVEFRTRHLFRDYPEADARIAQVRMTGNYDARPKCASCSVTAKWNMVPVIK
jgi:TolB-like protein